MKATILPRIVVTWIIAAAELIRSMSGQKVLPRTPPAFVESGETFSSPAVRNRLRLSRL